ncbi:Methylmalonyl-CoA carboxyltransferase 5S subunit [Planctomycetes bacterium CA13]|uniref:Methylmalonyl-CoA carboxyltransferase 5S subunit n=1 Tax=Novipirellula herctigrandis TaxID=2527986 RepID=A0A5C5Z3E6_9BACT|nr:Methylmalonyl-CoA carboxyltransferase 5S subunit [Planctomycetes bacterium CA13]
MSDKVIQVTDVILRDAHQSLMATRMAMEDMVPALHDLDQAGYWSLECWGGATFDSCIRFLNEDPWERLRTFKEHLKNTKTQMLLRAQNLLGYRHYADDTVDRFVDKAAENGMDVFRVFDALNDPRNLKRAMDAVRKTGKHAQGCISYTVSPVHTNAKYAELSMRLQELGADSICIKDMAALIKPQAAYDLVKAIKQACGDEMAVHLHVHATTGVTMVSLMKAIEAGCDQVDTSLSAMSLGTGHNPTESFVEMLEGTGYTTNIDLAAVARANKHFQKVKGRYSEFYTKFTGVKTDIFQSQIPGGMLSNMESQLKAQGAGDRLDEVLEEVPRVKKDAGYPPLVTPSSQIVGTQAVFNVMMGKYKKLTGEFADLMLGYYGKTSGEYNPEVVKIAQAQTGKDPITCRPADLLDNEWDKLKGEAESLEGFNGSDEDVLTNALFPQVAPKFFKTRSEGPKNLGKDPQAAAAEKPAAPAVAAASPAAKSGPRNYTVTVDGSAFEVTVSEGGAVTNASPVASNAAQAPAAASGSTGEAVKATLAGNVIKLVKGVGDSVATDETVMTLEAMKMETEVVAPKSGTIAAIHVKEGDAIAVGDTLYTLR